MSVPVFSTRRPYVDDVIAQETHYGLLSLKDTELNQGTALFQAFLLDIQQAYKDGDPRTARKILNLMKTSTSSAPATAWAKYVTNKLIRGKAYGSLEPLNKEQGATAVEYGLMVALIAIVIIGAVSVLGTNLTDIFNSVATSI